MLSDLLAANVVTLGDPHPQPDSGCYKDLIPVYHTVKHSEGKPELLTIWNAKYLNDTHPVTNVAFSYSHFGKLFSLLSKYHTQGKTPFFSKHDWRKFYNSLILGRLLKAGVVLEGRLQELLTTRAVFGRNTEPAIGQLVNESLWRERVRGPLHSTDVECMQILDDSLAVHYDKAVLDDNFCGFRKLGKFNGLVENQQKIKECVPSCVL